MELFVINDLIKKVKNKPFFWNGIEWENALDKTDKLSSKGYDYIIDTLAQYGIHPPKFQLIRFP